MIERLVSTCGQIGVMTKTPDSGSRIGPPAESEYAVDPVGVATIKPSALNSVSASPLTHVRISTRRDVSPRLRTASFNAIILLVCFSPNLTRASNKARWLKLIRSFAMHSTASRYVDELAQVRNPSEPTLMPKRSEEHTSELQ